MSNEQRDFVIRELFDTEANYVDVLVALRDKFMVPLERIIERDIIRTIFPRVRDLCDIHTDFLLKLHDAIDPTTRTKLGQVFLDFREAFLIYGEYCSCLTAATEMLTEQCRLLNHVDREVQVRYFRILES